MGALRSIEQEAVERASAEPMLEQVLGWSAINSGSRNLGGLERMEMYKREKINPVAGCWPMLLQGCRDCCGSRIQRRSRRSTPRGGRCRFDTGGTCT